MSGRNEKAPTGERQGFGVNHYEAIHMGNITAVQGGAQQLVRVFDGVIGEFAVPVCDGRELHAFLKNGKQFSDWIKQRIKHYGFEANQDYRCFSLKSEKPHGGRPGAEYHLTLDMAKELSMVENNEQGRTARRYFIAMERRALSAPAAGEIDPAQLERFDHSFHGRRIEFLVGDGQVWCKASGIAAVLGLGSSDRITRGLPASNKLTRVRGRQRHIYIDAAAAQRAGDYVRDANKAKAWADWVAKVLSELGRNQPANSYIGLDERTLACLYAMCAAGDRLVQAHQQLAPVHQAMRSNALLGVPAALEAVQVSVSHLREQHGLAMQAAAESAGLSNLCSSELLGVQLCSVLGVPMLPPTQTDTAPVEQPLQGELLGATQLTPAQRYGLAEIMDMRFMVAFDEAAKVQVKVIAKDAVVVPLAKLPDIIADPFTLNAGQLAGVMDAVTGRMKTMFASQRR